MRVCICRPPPLVCCWEPQQSQQATVLTVIIVFLLRHPSFGLGECVRLASVSLAHTPPWGVCPTNCSRFACCVLGLYPLEQDNRSPLLWAGSVPLGVPC